MVLVQVFGLDIEVILLVVGSDKLTVYQLAAMLALELDYLLAF